MEEVGLGEVSKAGATTSQRNLEGEPSQLIGAWVRKDNGLSGEGVGSGERIESHSNSLVLTHFSRDFQMTVIPIPAKHVGKLFADHSRANLPKSLVHHLRKPYSNLTGFDDRP